MKSIACLFLISFLSISFLAQTPVSSDHQFMDRKIITTPQPGAQYYSRNGQILKMAGVIDVLRSDSEAFNLTQGVLGQVGLGQTLSFIGGTLIGLPIGNLLAGGVPNWTLAAVGVGFLVVAIPLQSGGIKKLNTAVSAYNENLKTTGALESKTSLALIGNTNGLGFCFKF